MQTIFCTFCGAENSRYAKHCAACDRPLLKPNPEIDRIRTDLSCTFFFAGPEEYDGGELVIESQVGSGSTFRVLVPVGSPDAGAMPRITSGNTNSPTLMMAEKAAGWIIDEAHATA